MSTSRSGGCLFSRAVCGSGKSSLVFGTIAAESQRLINETYSTFVQDFMPNLARPSTCSTG
jgi:excinuclease UvrABC ATPase subunit